MKKVIDFLAIYIMFNMLLYILILSSLIILEAEQKSQIATVSTQLIRENFLFTDFRSVKKDLAKIKEENFIKIEAYNENKEKIITLNDQKNFFTIKTKRKIWSDSNQMHEKGTIVYYFSIHKLFFIALKPLAISLLFSFPLFILINNFILKREREKIENEKAKALNKISIQISHDIRSPLATIQTIVSAASNLQESDRKIFNEALNRINNIANSHLNSNRTQAIEEKSTFAVSEIIEQITNEKKSEYRDLLIEVNMKDYFLSTYYFALARIISNLINNSYESMTSNKKIIITSFEDLNGKYIQIQDFGHGISKSVLSFLGQKEISNKKEGNGLGFFHASETLATWGASLQILKTNSAGTLIQITFPKSSSQNFLFDNDELVCLTWNAKALKSNVQFEYSLNQEDFWIKVKSADKNANFYIDSELGDGLKGETIALRLFELGFKNIHLTTGYDKEHFNNLTFIKSILSKAPPF
ncbi:hypothetical protein DOM21_17550 [Bacteriovorax stolpii]|uniref:sensor histidine kinase n=1 Tax=Bacteriovorax stolpii TaxID=960 RepID=UPI001159D8EE|nr:HAMP domain-containing sensor histidine kinase [Bacteriovorax stolpii]QDK43228.1 hypothetical protein DOM21_17550 [Bacteriovorax stolpii]